MTRTLFTVSGWGVLAILVVLPCDDRMEFLRLLSPTYFGF